MEIIINGDKISYFGTHAGYALKEISEILEKRAILISKFFSIIYLLENSTAISSVTLDVYTRTNTIDIILLYKNKRLYFNSNDDESKKLSIQKDIELEFGNLSTFLNTKFVDISSISGGSVAYPTIFSHKHPYPIRIILTSNI